MVPRKRWTPLQDQEHGDNSPVGAVEPEGYTNSYGDERGTENLGGGDNGVGIDTHRAEESVAHGGARMGDTRAGDVDKCCVVGEIGAGFAGSSQCCVGAQHTRDEVVVLGFDDVTAGDDSRIAYRRPRRDLQRRQAKASSHSRTTADHHNKETTRWGRRCAF